MTAPPTVGMDAVLAQVHVDPDRVNVAALRGVSVPTPLAMKLTRDALRAANQYYNVFFDEGGFDSRSRPHSRSGRGAGENGEATEDLTGATASHGHHSNHHPRRLSGCSPLHRAPSTCSPSSRTCSPSSSSCSTSSSRSESDNAEGAGEATAAAPAEGEGRKLPRRKAPHPNHHMHTESLASPVNVRNTNYHTFFPPPLSHRQRKRLVHRIIGRKHARPFSQWPWHKSEAYHVLHARTIAQQHPSSPAFNSLGRQHAATPTPTSAVMGVHHQSEPPAASATAAATIDNNTPRSAAGWERDGGAPPPTEFGSSVSSVTLHHVMSKPGAFTGGYQVSPTVSDSHFMPFPLVSATSPRRKTGSEHAATVSAAGPAAGDRTSGGGGGGVGEIYRSILSRSSSSAKHATANGTAATTPTSAMEGATVSLGTVASPVSRPRADGHAPVTTEKDDETEKGESATAASPVTVANNVAAVAAAVGAGASVARNHTFPNPLNEGGGPAHDRAASPGPAEVDNMSIASAPSLGTAQRLIRQDTCPPVGRGDADLGTCTSPPPSRHALMEEESAVYTIPASQQGPEYFAQTAEDGTKTLVVVMVGLPARGKTFLAQKIVRLLGWHGTKAKVQNIQVAWRRALLDWEESRRKVEAIRATYQQEPLSRSARTLATAVTHATTATHHSGPAGTDQGSGGDSVAAAAPAEEGAEEVKQDAAAQVTSLHLQHDIAMRSVAEVENAPQCASMLPFLGRDDAAASEESTTTNHTTPTSRVGVRDRCTALPPPPATPSPHPESAPTALPSAASSPSKADAAPKALYLRTEHFEHLMADPNSIERRLYRQVLRSFAADCDLFFASGGEVIIINDDFVTEDLREEAKQLFKPLAANLVFMEVTRDAELNKRFNACKVKDPLEYPKDRIGQREAKKDFESRLKLLERFYEPLIDARDAKPRRGRGGCSGNHSTDSDDTDGSGGGDDEDDETDETDECQTAERERVPNRRRHDAATTAAVGQTKAKRRRPVVRSYIKIRNSDMIETHGIRGYLASRIISYVMNLSQVKIQHPIYFVRHGESCYNLEDRIGGNPLLTEQGMRDAAALLEFMDSLKSHLEHIDRHQQYRQQQQQQQAQCQKKLQAEEQGAERLQKQHALKNRDDGSSLPLTARQVSSSPESAGVGDYATSSVGVGAFLGKTPPSSYPTAAGGAGGATAPAAAPGGGTAALLAPLFSPHTNLDNSSANNLEIWTSQLRRTIQTAELSERLLNIKTLRWSSLNEIHAGICEDMTYAEVKKEYPLIEKFRKQSKYTFRYPEGESYQDLVVRLEPVIMELENADKVVVVVAHQAVLRCLLAYFGSTSAESSIRVEVPHRTVWRCTYDSKGIASLEELTLDNLDAGFAPLKPLTPDADDTQQQIAHIVRETDGI